MTAGWARLINNSGILDYAVGNFDGNKQGMEQVYSR